MVAGNVVQQVALLFLLASAVSAGAAGDAAAAPAVDPAAPCVSSGCHSDFNEHSTLHWPGLAQECGECHRPAGSGHEFTVADAPELCSQCHEDRVKEIYAQKNIHFPLEDGCLDCHKVHGSEASALLSAEPEDGLCLDCHDDLIEGEYKHEPAQEGQCVSCHDPHSSPNSSLLLNAEISALCWDCHDDHGKAMNGAKYQHEAGDCTNCHNPHSADHPRMLPAKGRRLCAECHEEVVEAVEGSAVDHGAALKGDECVNCHSPHGADEKPLLKDKPQNLCLGCHDKRLRSGNSVLLDMQAWLDDNEQRHKPLTEKDTCVQCHSPHGSEHLRLLKAPFPAGFYAGFKVDRYELCFSCHDRKAFTLRETSSSTGFRDGTRNLHYLHVNRAEKGRTCRACHDFHAAGNVKLVRDRVRFGQWMLPIDFEITPTGGSCQPGCHPAVGYDREAAR